MITFFAKFSIFIFLHFLCTAAQNVTHGAVAMEIAECSQVGADILSLGGNAADAMIAGCLCVGTIASYHSYSLMLVKLAVGGLEGEVSCLCVRRMEPMRR